jgi:hypothetical protein
VTARSFALNPFQELIEFPPEDLMIVVSTSVASQFALRRGEGKRGRGGDA